MNDQHHSRGSTPSLFVLAIALAFGFAGVAGWAGSSEAKRKPAPPKEPDLKILAVTFSADPFVPGEGALDLRVEVALPQDLDGATLLEVSSLISSPSKRSVRFLAERQPIGALPPAERPSEAPDEKAGVADPDPRRVSVILRWDGTDQTKQVVSQGRYNYEVRAKLLAVGENGPRTYMVSWPKRGTLEVQ